MTRIDKQALLEWLRTWEPEDVVGRSYSPTDCVLAHYARAKLGAKYVHVNRVNIFIDAECAELPSWAKYFEQRCDDEHARAAPITAREAINYLTNPEA